MIVRSIRTRIQLWHTVMLALIVSGLGVVFYAHEKAVMLREIDHALSGPVTRFLGSFVPPPRGRQRSGFTPRRPGEGDAWSPGSREEVNAREVWAASPHAKNGKYLAFVNRNGEPWFRTETAPQSFPPGQMPEGDFRSRVTYRYNAGNREVVHYGPQGMTLILGVPIWVIKADLARLRWWLIVGGVLLVGGAHGVGYWLTSRSLRPIEKVSETATRMAEGEWDQRIDLKETDSELGQMAGVLNKTFDKLSHAFDQQVRFTADASHELRTPISVILSSCQFALRRNRSGEEYREALASCEQSAQHIRRLGEALLDLARVDSGEFRLAKEQIDLAPTVAASIRLLGQLAEERQIVLESEIDPCPGFFDAGHLQQVVINLLSNAIKYTPEGGRVRITLQAVAAEAVIIVEDNGNGIAREDLPHLFDRFYRVDKARPSDKENTGLGLAISQAIVSAHGGRIEVESQPGEGTLFRIVLPCTA